MNSNGKKTGRSNLPTASLKRNRKRRAKRRNKTQIDHHSPPKQPQDAMDHIPEEILEEIFSYLNLQQLILCSKVCLKWREVINCNLIWSRLSMVEHIYHLNYLDDSHIYLRNPVEKYRKLDEESRRFSDDCHWKKHYKRYQKLMTRWKYNRSKSFQIGFSTTYYKNRLAVNAMTRNIHVYDINKDSKSIISVEHSDLRVDSVYIHDEFLFYVQGCHIVCMQRNNADFNQVYSIEVENKKCSHTAGRSEGDRAMSEPSVRLMTVFSTRHVVAVDNAHPCKLFFYHLTTGTLDKEVDIRQEKAYCVASHCMTVFEDRLYLSYTWNAGHFITCYDPTQEGWTFCFEVDIVSPARAFELILSKNFICAKLATQDQIDNCELQIWSLQNHEESYTHIADKRVPVILTHDGISIFSEAACIYVSELSSSSERIYYEMKQPGKVINMALILDKYLLVNNSVSLQIWDWRNNHTVQLISRKRYTSMWVDNTTVVARRCEETTTTSGFAFW